jgi:hypothetical protein
METDAESPTFNELEKNEGKNVLWYETTVTTHKSPHDDAAKKIVVKQGEWDMTNDKRGPEQLSKTFTSEEPSLVAGAVNINTFGRVVIRDVGLGGKDVPGAEAVSIAIAQLVAKYKGFDTWPEFDAAVKNTDLDLRAARDTILDLVRAARRASPPTLKVR